jgi:hypothetical protein
MAIFLKMECINELQIVRLGMTYLLGDLHIIVYKFTVAFLG